MKAVITLDDVAVPTIEIENGGVKRTVHTSLRRIIELINSSIDEEIDIKQTSDEQAKVVALSPTLPMGTMKYAKLDNGTEFLLIAFPSQTANVSYHDTTFENVPFPNLVFSFKVNKNRMNSIHVMAYKGRNLRENTELFEFPFANVYRGNGMLCYYNNHEIVDLVELQSFCHNWLHTPMNDHLYHQGRTNKLDKSLREILQDSQNKEFNYDMLNSANKTFGQWAAKLI